MEQNSHGGSLFSDDIQADNEMYIGHQFTKRAIDDPCSLIKGRLGILNLSIVIYQMAYLCVGEACIVLCVSIISFPWKWPHFWSKIVN